MPAGAEHWMELRIDRIHGVRGTAQCPSQLVALC